MHSIKERTLEISAWVLLAKFKEPIDFTDYALEIK